MFSRAVAPVLFVCASQAFSWSYGSNNQVEYASDCDWTGGDIGSQQSAGADCGGICVQDSQCTHFTWFSNVCYKKRFSSPATAVSKTGATCGFRVSAPAPAPAPSCYEKFLDFSNGPVPGWDLQGTDSRQGWANGEWRLFSNGATDSTQGWSRMRYKDFTFNSNPGSWTNIKIKVRGAPNGGKNSNAYLIQSKGDYSLQGAVQDGSKDEIDFFEYYGGPTTGRNQDTYNVFRSGQTIASFPKTYPISDAGNNAYTYEIILDNHARTLVFMVWNAAGQQVKYDSVSGNNVPSNPLELFIGIWDCSKYGFCPGSYQGVSYMAVLNVYIKAC